MPLYEDDSKINGTGLFSTAPIKRDQLILILRRNIVSLTELMEYAEPDRAYQVHPQYYLAPSDHLEGCVNHSCFPNAEDSIKIFPSISIASAKVSHSPQYSLCLSH